MKVGEKEFKTGDILLVINDILAEEVGIPDPYLSKGSKLKVVNVFDKHVDARLISGPAINSYDAPNGVFMIIQDDVTNGDVVSINEMRNDKIQTILNEF